MWGKAIGPLLAVVAAGILGWGNPAWAQPARAVRLDIPAQDVLTALKAFSRATGLTVAADPRLLAGRHSASVSGRYEAAAGLDRLLSSAGLAARPAGAGFVIFTMTPSGNSQASGMFAPSGADEVVTLSEIVVTGVRAAAASSIEARRDASGVREIIFAEEVARLPEQNLAEAIQRAAGVQITRAFGEGQQVGVRGIGPEFTQVLLNGARLASDTAGRETDLDILSADIFSRIDIIKTASADLPEGGLGGTVLLETPKPFDFVRPPTLLALGATSGAIDPRLSPQAFLTTGYRSADDRFGILASVRSYQTRGGQDGASTVSWERRNLDLDGDRLADIRDIFLPRVPRALIETRDRQRLDGMIAVQIEPWTGLGLDLQVTGSHQRDKRGRHTMDGVLRAGDIVVKSLETEGENALAGSFSNVEQRSENISDMNDQRLLHAVVSARWQHAAENYTLTFSRSRAQEVAPLNTRILFSARGDFGYDFTDNRRIPSLSTSLDLRDPDTFRLSQIRYESYENRDRIDGFRFQSDRRSDGRLSLLRYGVQIEDREKTRDHGLLNDSSEAGRRIGEFVRPSRPDFPLGLRDVPHGFTRQWLVTDDQAARRALVPANFQVPVDYSDSFSVRETTYSVFGVVGVEGGWDGLPVSADLGLRLVGTDQQSRGWRTQDGLVTPVSSRKSYADALPNLDLRAQLTDRVVLDLSLARVLTRATLNDLSPREAIDIFGLRILRGNPDLEPFRAWQIDLGYTYYFAPSALMSVTTFAKSIDSFITTETIRTEVEGLTLARDGNVVPNGEVFTITRPINGEAATLSGVELGYRQPSLGLPAPFEGVGFSVNYTYAQSEARVSTGQISRAISLPGQSRHTLNFIASIENSSFSIQAVYNYRSSYVGRPFIEGDQTEIFSSYGQADLLALFRARRNIDVYVNFFNVLSETSDAYAGDPIRILFHQGTGPSLVFGARVRL